MSAQDLPPLPHQQKVIVQTDLRQNHWTPATVTRTPTPRKPGSYSVATKGGTHLGNHASPTEGQVTKVPALTL